VQAAYRRRHVHRPEQVFGRHVAHQGVPFRAATWARMRGMCPGSVAGLPNVAIRRRRLSSVLGPLALRTRASAERVQPALEVAQ
jgi:hypothetical protein